MNFPQAIEFIEGFINYETRRSGVRYDTRFFHLENFARFLAAAGFPQNSFKSIHIAGTKGKGSTAAFVHSMLTEAGYRCGLYTSPHLHSYCERIRIGREPVSETQFAAALDEVRRVWEKFSAADAPSAENKSYRTAFELVTAAAFAAFCGAGVEWAVIETGLGGRLDATNVIDPQICAITALGLEHTEILGGTIEQIAAEKCGIIKPGVPVVLAAQAAADRAAIAAVAAEFCRKQNAPLIHAAPCSPFQNDSSLRGGHQDDNLNCALTVIRNLRERGLIGATDAQLQHGICRTVWPGRFEQICENPPVLLDAAHCLISFRALSAVVAELLPERIPLLVFGCKESKKPAEILAPIFGRFPQAAIYAAPIPAPDRLAPREICGQLREKFPAAEIREFDDLRAAMDAAWRRTAQEAPGRYALIVCGSLYHLEPARQLFENELRRAPVIAAATAALT